MEAISALDPSAAQAALSAADGKEVPKERKTEDAASRPQAPRMDAYVPEKGREEPSAAHGPGKKAAGDGEARCTVNTDKVDREVEKLKRMQEELKQRINAEADAAKRETLEAKLAQVEQELRQKDNDAYRRQHAVYTYA